MFQITPRERVMLQFLAEGHTTNELAACLGVSLRKLDVTLMLLFQKMGVGTEVEAKAQYMKRGLFDRAALRSVPLASKRKR